MGSEKTLRISPFSLMSGIGDYILSIFLDPALPQDTSVHTRSLLQHYVVQLDEVFFDDILVATEYKYISHVLELYKFHSDRRFARVFAHMFLQIWKDSGVSLDGAVIVSVPMHWSRYWMRGFDHMGRIADILSRETHMAHKPLLRARFSWRQARLSRENRLKNKRNSYVWKGKIPPKTVVLIDDVVTTAATLNACAQVLKNA